MAYQKQVWENLPSQNTPLNADRLNHIEDGIYEASAGTSIEVHNDYNNSTTEPYSANYVNKLSNYSTEETVCGRWIDGKPLYRKVITGTKVSGTELAITVDNNLDEIVMTYGGRLIRTDLNRGYAIPMYESSNVYVRVELKQDTKQIAIVSSTGQYSNGNVSIVVYYTKITD